MRCWGGVAGTKGLLLASVVPLCLLPTIVAGQELRVRQLHSTKGNPSTPFGSVTDALQVDDGSIWVTDENPGGVWRWSLETGSVRQIQRNGDGPGEVRHPVRLARRPRGGVALYDLGHSAVNLFDRNLRFERRVQLPGIVSWPKGLLALPDGSFVLAGGQLRHHNQLHRFSETGEILERWGDPHPDAMSPHTRIQAMGGALHAVGDGTFLFSLSSPLRVMRFPSGQWSGIDTLVTGDLLPELTDDYFLMPQEDGGVGIRWDYPKTTAVWFLEDRRIMNVITRKDEDDSIWDLYGTDGMLISRTEVGVPYDVRQYLGDGRVLALMTDPATDESVVVILGINGF